MHFDYTDNVLVAGTLGRGAWTLQDPFGDFAAGLSLETSTATGLVDFVAAAFLLPWGDRGSWTAPPTPVAAIPTWEAPPRASRASVDRYFADATTEDRTFTDSGSRPDAGAVSDEGLADVFGQDSWLPEIA